MSWWRRQARTIPQVAAALGWDGSIRRGFRCPFCAAARRHPKRGDTRLPVGVVRSGGGFRCHECDAHGGWIDYLAGALFGAGYDAITPDQAAEVRRWCEGQSWETLAPAAPTDEGDVYPDDVDRFWARCRSVLTSRSGLPWMQTRGFGARLQLVAEADLARFTPRAKGDYPSWWPLGRMTHWRLFVQAVDVHGELRSVHARAIGSPEIDGKPAPKTLWPKHPDPDQRYSAHGLFFACTRARALLRGEETSIRVLLLVEGCTDWLSAAAWAEERERAGGAPVAVLGGVSGSWATLTELRDRLPNGLLIVAAMDQDETGEAYASTASAALSPRPVMRLYFGLDAEGRRVDVDSFLASGGDLGAALNRALRGESRPGLHEELLAWWAQHPEATSQEVARVFDVKAGVARKWRCQGGDQGAPQADPEGAPCPDPRAPQGAPPAEQGDPGADPDADPDLTLVERALGALLKRQPLPKGMVVPSRYYLTPRGIWRKGDEDRPDVPVTTAPILITGRLHHLDSPRMDLQVAWWVQGRAGGRWHETVVPGRKVADTKAILELRDLGAPVHAGNARDVVKWLAAFEAANAHILPAGRLSLHLGWQPGMERAFLLGRRLVTPRGERLFDEASPSARWDDEHLHFAADGQGYGQVVSGYRTAGTPEGWLQALEQVRDRPAVWLAIYASLLPPMLRLVPELVCFTIDWSGPTSLGKSTATRMAASVWGCPDERDPKTVLHLWSKTKVWIERVMGATPDLPMILDDSQKARTTEIPATIVYKVEGGQGDGRGTREGIQETTSFRTILLSTGEQPITTLGQTTHGGAVARAVELWGSPLGEESEANARLARLVKSLVFEHYGHLGLALVRWLVAKDRAPFLRQRYRELLAWTSAQQGTTGAAYRAADYIVGLQLAREVAHEALGLPRPVGEDPVLHAIGAIQRNVQRADVAISAMRDVLGWAASNRARFRTNADAPRQAPSQGWLGVWDSRPGWEQLALYPHELRAFLVSQRYASPAGLLKTWADKGWLSVEHEHVTKKLMVDGQRERLVVVLKRAWAELMGAPERAEPDQPTDQHAVF